jgi:hypothetical protein
VNLTPELIAAVLVLLLVGAALGSLTTLWGYGAFDRRNRGRRGDRPALPRLDQTDLETTQHLTYLPPGTGVRRHHRPASNDTTDQR